MIYSNFSHGIWENYFSGDKVMDWMRKVGFGAIMMCMGDLLLKHIPEKYVHKKKMSTSQKPKVVRFF